MRLLVIRERVDHLTQRRQRLVDSLRLVQHLYVEGVFFVANRAVTGTGTGTGGTGGGGNTEKSCWVCFPRETHGLV